METSRTRTVLWWGRFDPDYSRNRIQRALLRDLGWQIRDFHPFFSGLGGAEAWLRRIGSPDLVWMPCFRQRDIAAASRWARRRGVPVLIDPLISAYDKQVAERGKLAPGSPQARKLLAWERDRFARADLVLADTPAHAAYFSEVLGVKRERLAVVYVGAEETLFYPTPVRQAAEGAPLEVLFYGSFIPLQGAEVVIEAARLYAGPPVRWTLLGQGPLRTLCEEKARGLDNVAFESWMPYEQLAARIARAEILLGVFGTTQKAARVIPNKVYQALASGRAVVTQPAEAYPESLRIQEDSGLVWSPAGDPHALAGHVAALAANRDRLRQLGEAAAATSDRYFSGAAIRNQLAAALEKLSV
jgi:glycosyltransferase involved in cell wall biosynthesis